jgi:AraC-like DNA-binding protein
MKANFTCHLSPPENSFRAFVKTQNEDAATIHFHSEYEINLVIQSNGTRYVGNSIDHFEEGELTLLAPNIPHCLKSTSKKQHPYSSLVIQWKEDLLENSWRHIPEFDNIHRLLMLSNKGIKFDKYIGNEIRDKQAELLRLPPFEKLITFLQLLNDLAKTQEFKTLCDQKPFFSNDSNSARIETVYNFIREKYAEKITLAKMAGITNMSEGAFSRFFSQAAQKPFFSFLNEYRINIACKYLMETDLRVNEIGYACGYECLQFFYRQFMKYMKCSPSLYRKRLASA